MMRILDRATIVGMNLTLVGTMACTARADDDAGMGADIGESGGTDTDLPGGDGDGDGDGDPGLSDYPGPCASYVDQGADGIFEERSDFEYDAAGRLLVESRVIQLSGTEYWREEHDWDEAGRVIARREFQTGELQELEGWVYDSQGRLIAYSNEFPAQPELGWDRLIEISHEPAQIVTTHDDGIDGTIDYLQIDLLDAQGRIIETTRDTGADGQLEWRIFQEWVGEVVVEFSADKGDDGTIDHSWSATLDADGRPALTEYDDDGDGQVDLLELRGWDEHAELALFEEYTKPDDTLTWRTTYARDLTGRLVEEVTEPGLVVERKVWSFVDGPDTTEVTFTRDNGNDGSVEQLQRTIESSAGDLLERWDGDGAGVIQNYTFWTYDCWP